MLSILLFILTYLLNILDKVKEHILLTQTFWNTSVPMIAGLLCWFLTLLIKRQQPRVKRPVALSFKEASRQLCSITSLSAKNFRILISLYAHTEQFNLSEYLKCLTTSPDKRWLYLRLKKRSLWRTDSTPQRLRESVTIHTKDQYCSPWLETLVSCGAFINH